MTTSVQPPFLVVNDLNGQPLDAGFVYIGVANMDPVGNPIAIFSDIACTVALTNPVRTLGGFIDDGSGTPVNIYVAGSTDFSMAVHDRFNQALYSVPTYPVRLLSASITFGAITASSVNPLAVGTGTVGTNAVNWLEMVARTIRTRAISVFGSTQPAAPADLAKITQRTMPLASCIYRVTPLLTNNYNVASVTVNGPGDYNVNLTVPCPLGVAPTVSVTADTPARTAIGDIDVGRTFIHVTTFDAAGAPANSGFHLFASVNASVADPIL
jgi:hypothetical protein